MLQPGNTAFLQPSNTAFAPMLQFDNTASAPMLQFDNTASAPMLQPEQRTENTPNAQMPDTAVESLSGTLTAVDESEDKIGPAIGTLERALNTPRPQQQREARKVLQESSQSLRQRRDQLSEELNQIDVQLQRIDEVLRRHTEWETEFQREKDTLADIGEQH
ncbi:hypothetical protein ACHAPJ_003915 [Fusarium lateritium]